MLNSRTNLLSTWITIISVILLNNVASNEGFDFQELQPRNIYIPSPRATFHLPDMAHREIFVSPEDADFFEQGNEVMLRRLAAKGLDNNDQVLIPKALPLPPNPGLLFPAILQPSGLNFATEPTLLQICSQMKARWGNDAPHDASFKRACSLEYVSAFAGRSLSKADVEDGQILGQLAARFVQ